MRDNSRLLFIFPLLIFIVLVVFLWQGLSLDPHKLPSALLNKPAPQFKLSTVQETNQQFTNKDVRGKISLLNVWSSWCATCRDEHSILMEITRDYQIPIYGVDYKDQRSAAIEWLQKFGNPYRLAGFDGDGSVQLIGISMILQKLLLSIKQGLFVINLLGSILLFECSFSERFTAKNCCTNYGWCFR